MKLFSLSLILTIARAEGFAPSTFVAPSVTVGGARRSQLNHHLDEIHHDTAVVFDDAGVALDEDTGMMAIKFITALTFALGMMIAVPRDVFAIDDQYIGGSSSSVVVSAASGVKDSDIVDFSMPSYQEASRSAVNSNLKGDKYLLGEASKTYGQSSSSSSSSSVEEVKKTEPVSVVDVKAEKEAAKAAMKAARAAQQAAAEAAAN